MTNKSVGFIIKAQYGTGSSANKFKRAQTVIYGTGSLLSRRAERTQIKEEENMKKAISMAMAAALALSAGATTVPVMADDVTELTIWSPTDTEAIEHGGKKSLQNGIKKTRISR